MSKIEGLCIDPQWDFCHPGMPGYDPTNPNTCEFTAEIEKPGALYVPGAEKGCYNIANMITKSKKKFDGLSVSLDSHRSVHVAHADYYRDNDGNMPNPFDIITLDDFTGPNAKWKTYCPKSQDWIEKSYLPGLRDRNRNPLCIWPKHCIIGENGWRVYPPVSRAIREWCEGNWSAINWKLKGQNTRTEWYSAVGADFEDPADRQTWIDTDFIARFDKADLFVLFGFARTHCLRWTFSDIINHFGDKFLKKTLLVEDCTADVPIPEVVTATDEFFAECKRNGMQTCTAEQFVSDV